MFRELSHGLTLLLFMTLPQTASAQDVDASLRGIVKAVYQAVISSDLGLRITSIPFREGQSFKVGDRLVEFDCAKLRAELSGSEARLMAEQLTYENNQRLEKLNAAGNFEVLLSEAKTNEAAATVEAFRVQTEQCTITAPFDGRVAANLANAFEIAEPSRPLLQIVSDKNLEIEMLLPSSWLVWLAVGTPLDITIDEASKTLPAEVIRIAPIVDPVSQTVKVVARFSSDAAGILPGMSGPVQFQNTDG